MFNQDISVTARTFSLMRATEGLIPESEQKSQLTDILRESCERVSLTWPLTNFIAANPLKGYENYPFEKAIQFSENYFHAKGLPDLTFFYDQFRKGRITPRDLATALQEEPQENRDKILQILIQEASQIPEGKTVEEYRKDQVFILPTECIDQSFGTRLYSWSQVELVKWCAAFFDAGQAAWSMPGKEQGFYRAWKNLAEHDRSYEMAGVKGFRKFVKNLPDNAEDAIAALCDKLKIPTSRLSDYFSRHFASLPGWSGLFAYRGSELAFLKSEDKNSPLVDWLAVRMAYDVAGALWAGEEILFEKPTWDILVKSLRKRVNDESHKHENEPSINLGMIWLKAFESNYRNQLIKSIRLALGNLEMRGQAKTQRPDAQFVFCIDVRSEGFRRHLEKTGNYHTYGFAGFFAIPLAFKPAGSDEALAQCPVLIRPKYLVEEELATKDQGKVKQYLLAQKSSKELKDVMKEVKSTSVAPFSFVEAFGGLGLIGLVFRSLRNYLVKSTDSITKLISAGHPTVIPKLSESCSSVHLYTGGIPLADQVAIAENSLRFMGLTENFGRLIVLCGHGSETQNNPFASSLDCGACGGHPGASNARVAAAIFNSDEVRAKLGEKGITIPKDTWFVAAEHNTTNDQVVLIDEWTLPSGFEPVMRQIRRDLKTAGENLNLERVKRFGENMPEEVKGAVSEVNRRSNDWSEVRPEWGLVGNAAFIVGRRDLTKDLNLGCRTFLHSYEWEKDGEGKALEVIMTAPMIVTQWINSQYYFSSVDPAIFGSGNKTIHNVVGKVGVMEGNVSDFKMGLPFQSVSTGDHLQHEPMRLTVLIEAPTSRISSIVKKHESVKKLVANDWIRIVAIDAQSQSFSWLNHNLEWVLEN